MRAAALREAPFSQALVMHRIAKVIASCSNEAIKMQR
jgi:hypothetical protein